MAFQLLVCVLSSPGSSSCHGLYHREGISYKSLVGVCRREVVGKRDESGMKKNLLWFSRD